MGTFWKLVAIALGPGILFSAVGIALATLDTVAAKGCNTWSECAADVHLIAFICGLVLTCSSAGLLVAGLLQLRAVRKLTSKWLATLVVLLAALQAAMFFTLNWWSGEDVMLTLYTWAGISALLGWVVLAASRRLAPNNSSKPTPLRGAA